MRHPIWIVLTIIFLVATLVMSFLYVQANNDYQALIGTLMDRENQSLFIVNDQLLDATMITESDRNYIPYDVFVNHVDQEARLSNSGYRTYLKYKNIKAQTDSKFANDYISRYVDEISIPVIYVENKAYVSEAEIKQLYGIATKYFPETKSYYISTDARYDMGLVAEKASIYFDVKGQKIEYPVEPENQDGIILRRVDGYVELLNNDGKIHYVKEDGLIKIENIEEDLAFMAMVRENLQGDISIAFEGIEGVRDNFKKEPKGASNGFNVLAPTWFKLNIQGIMLNHADMAYVEKAHEYGDHVWAVITNDFNPDWTNEMLNNLDYRRKFIGQMLFYTALYNFDGINLDFENMYLGNQAAYTDFVKECYEVFNAYGIPVSIDVTRPGGSDMWSKVYDRQALSEYVDYVVLMAYDEFWGSSPTAGSVASLPWTEKSITMSLEEIPKDKLILALPLYMRAWVVNGNSALSSTAQTLNSIDAYLEGISYDLLYDEASGQNYAELVKDQQNIKIWFEDELSMEKRLNLYQDYDLPGVAVWRKGYEESWVWDMINKYLNMN